MSERACAEFVIVNGVKLVCGEAESLHTPEAARGDVGMDHKFIPATWDATPEQCPEGWVACEQDRPCARHVEYWRQYAKQDAQIPGEPPK